jgi:hypothetical protein
MKNVTILIFLLPDNPNETVYEIVLYRILFNF